MRHRQRGITAIGWIILLMPVALVVYSGIRLTPFYLNYMKVVKALDQTADEYAGDSSVDAGKIRRSLAKRFDIDLIDSPKDTEILVRKGTEGWEMEADYEEAAPLFANVQLLVAFNKRVVVPKE
jgi:hypothetical protein